MCGIAGVFRLHGIIPIQNRLSDLTKMPSYLLHRGPENLGMWNDSEIFLAQTRLKIIDLSDQANPPIFNEDKNIVLVFNGEIYNYRDLRKELRRKGHRFVSDGDSEVIVHLYEEEGNSFLTRLDGMFSFGLWDQRKRTLILARDRTGKKPLFYYQCHSFFAFASEIKAFFPLKEIPIEKNTDFFPYYFIYGNIPTPHTFYKNIYSLEPGHSLIVTPHQPAKKVTYWHPEIYFSSKKNTPSQQEAMSHIKILLKEAVSKRLVSDVRLGAFLSGGIDSSIITAIVTKECHQSLKTFSIGFEGDHERDETRYARLAASHFETDHTEFHFTADHLPKLFDKLLFHYDGPFGDPSCVPTALVSELAKKEVTVVLTGDGGDEVFAGYNRFLASLWMNRVPKFLWSVQDRVTKYLHMPLPQTWQRLTQAAPLSLEDRLTCWTAFFYNDLFNLLNKDFISGLTILKNFHYLPYLEKTKNMDPLSKMLYLNLKTYLLDDLNTKMDRASMRVALETRSPFLDHHLIEYCASLPSHFFIKGFHKKHILKEAYKEALPAEIYHRGKLGFDAPLGKWFRGPLKSFLCDELTPLSDIKAYVNPSYVHALLKEHFQGIDHSLKLWNMLMFKKWISVFPSWFTQA